VKVLVIPEDPVLDEHILKPIIEQIFAGLEIKTRVEVLKDPRMRGASQALDPETVKGVVEDNPMIDLFLLMVDRDCNRDGHEAKARSIVEQHADKLLACLAREEVEVWALALHRNDLPEMWNVVRAECDPKERYFNPLVAQKQWKGPGGGRKRAMKDLGKSFRGLLQLCDELTALSEQIAAWLKARAV
jgi:hypothetical protein